MSEIEKIKKEIDECKERLHEAISDSGLAVLSEKNRRTSKNQLEVLIAKILDDKK